MARSIVRSREPKPERLMYRVHLFEELLSIAGADTFRGERILEVGPKDGLDSRRLASLLPAELVLLDLPGKREMVQSWLPAIKTPYRYVEANLLYMPLSDLADLGTFDLIWCTGVLYHNAEQLKFLRRLWHLLNVDGYLVLESATLRGSRTFRNARLVEIHYPDTYRDTGTITHLPTAGAIKAWLLMVGFSEIKDAAIYGDSEKKLSGQRFACICRRHAQDQADAYYRKSGLNPRYEFGDST